MHKEPAASVRNRSASHRHRRRQRILGSGIRSSSWLRRPSEAIQESDDVGLVLLGQSTGPPGRGTIARVCFMGAIPRSGERRS